MRIYLDNNTTTAPSDKTISKMIPYLNKMWGNQTSPHQMGQELFPGIDDSLKAIYRLLEANKNDQFVFTSSGAEAVNQAILSTYFDITKTTGKNQFITSTIDEAPALMSVHRLEQLGSVGKIVKPDSHGKVTAEILADSITPRTALISLSWANGLTGVINPVHEIAKLCKERGIRLHLDATHVLGKLFFNLEELEVHLISFNGDNIHAPKGTGGLYIREGTVCSPLITGGIEQAGKRGGNFSVAALAALGNAAEEAYENRDLICTETARLRDKFEKLIQQEIPNSVVLFHDQDRLPNCTAIAFPGIVNEALLFLLNRKNLFASIGGGSFQQIGLILKECGIQKKLAQTAINFSLSRETNDDQIERAAAIISDAVKQLQKTIITEE